MDGIGPPSKPGTGLQEEVSGGIGSSVVSGSSLSSRSHSHRRACSGPTLLDRPLPGYSPSTSTFA